MDYSVLGILLNGVLHKRDGRKEWKAIVVILLTKVKRWVLQEWDEYNSRSDK